MLYLLYTPLYKATMKNLTSLINQYIIKEGLPDSYLDVAQQWFIPLCDSIDVHQNESSSTKSSPYFVGVNGCQGSGKSTLCGLLEFILKEYYTKNAITFSLDDFYFTKSERTNLANNVHPLLATRGVPGTHDTVLLRDVLKALSLGQTVKIPTFDKSIDDRSTPDKWRQINNKVDIVIMEGWCWGTQAEPPQALLSPINMLEKEQDPDAIWRNFVNRSLQSDYVPLYEYMDAWIFLKAPSFNEVYEWRLQQEQKLRQRVGNASNVMSDQEVLTFIQFYQRLTEHTLCTFDKDADWIFDLDCKRKIIKSRQNE
jgi:D-glycerate 3-kinase